MEKFSDLLGKGSKLTLENDAVMNYFHLAKIMEDINNSKVLIIHKDWTGAVLKFETLVESEVTQTIIDLETKILQLMKDHREEMTKLKDEYDSYRHLMDTTLKKRIDDSLAIVEKKLKGRSLWHRILNK